MIAPYILFAIGLILIIKGGDYFVDAAVWIAKVTGLPEVLIGATIVSLGTTLPEASVSVLSAIQNQSTMAIGNAIGSTICNTGLILGIYNLIKPSKIESKIFNIKGLLMLAYIGIFWFISRNKYITQTASLILLSMLALYIVFNLIVAGRSKSDKSTAASRLVVTPKEFPVQIGKFILGIILIVFGANLLVKHGVTLATMWGIPAAVISLTLIALGTSLPELVTSITALIKGHSGISIGNILGANILNITMVIGASAQFGTLEITKQTFYFDIPATIIINSLLVIPSIFTKRISRFQALMLLAAYFIYIMLLFYINHPA